MYGAPIKELQEGVDTFLDELLEDEVAKYSAEVAIVTFGDDVEVLVDFAAVTRQEVPTLKAGGSTPMGEAVEIAIDLLNTRKEEYKRAGVDYYQPWLVLMTDGEPTDDISRASRNIDDLTQRNRLAVIPIGIGKDANMRELAKLSGNQKPRQLEELNSKDFKDFFLKLSKSISRASQSVPGDKDLDPVKLLLEV